MLQVTVRQRWQGSDAGTATDGVAPFGRTGISCGRDDIKVGDTFAVQLGAEDERMMDCSMLSCPVDFPSASAPSGVTFTSPGGPHICMSGHRKVALQDGCEARRFVSLSGANWESQVSVPSASTSAAQTFVLTRSLAVSSDQSQFYACATASSVFPAAAGNASGSEWFCTDSYLVSLSKK